MFKKTLAFIMLTFILTNCVSLNSLSLTSLPHKRTHKITAETSKLIFLWFNFSNDYVLTLTKDLKRKCPQGKVQGILTKYTTTNYILLFNHKITAQGYCVKGA